MKLTTITNVSLDGVTQGHRRIDAGTRSGPGAPDEDGSVGFERFGWAPPLLDDEDEARGMLAELGVDEPGLDVLARVGFETLGLQTYLTAGPKESRAWTIPRGATAPEAAGVIHTDFQRGFIKAEIVSFDDLVAAGSMAAAKAAGKVRMEGKDYVMADGDVVEFRFNV